MLIGLDFIAFCSFLIFLKMALLSKDCVDENWKRRPDMSNAAIRLSRILISSKEWEKMECCHNL